MIFLRNHSCRPNLANAVYKTNQRTLEELKRNIHDKINNINRGETTASYGKFNKEVPKMYGQQR